LLLIVTNLTLQKAISNLIINKNKTGSFKWWIFSRPHICPLWWTGVSINDCYFKRYELCSDTHRFVSTCVWDILPSRSSQE
jgi:hypothetical protein